MIYTDLFLKQFVANNQALSAILIIGLVVGFLIWLVKSTDYED